MEEPPVSGQKRRKVVIVHTGGTIFMRKTERGRDVGELTIPKDKDGNISNHIDLEVIDLFGGGGIDSSKMTLEHSKKLAEKIVELQNDPTVHGIVVTHGTDTMAETAIELSYALKNLRKPVVLTGSQIPTGEPNSDGLRNLFRSVYLAAHASALRRVVICFGYPRPLIKSGRSTRVKGFTPANFVLEARNAEKSHILRQDAFLHADSKVIGTVAVTRGIDIKSSTRNPTGPAYSHFGFSGWTKRHVLQRHNTSLPVFATGLVVDVYGSGNIPDAVIRRLSRRARFYPVVAASQAHGKVDLTAYAAGRPALEAGVLPSGGLTPLSASKRLAYLAAHRWEVRKYARKNKVGYRTLLSTLFLSGAEFDHQNVKWEHSKIIGVPIVSEDLLIQLPFEQAMEIAVEKLKEFKDKLKQRVSRAKS